MLFTGYIGLAAGVGHEGLFNLIRYILWVFLFVGYPQLHIAIVSATGIIDDYTQDGEKNRTFPRFQNKRYSDHYPNNNCCKGFSSIPYNIFGVYHDRVLYFLTCNPKEGVTKYNIDNHHKEKVSQWSKIENSIWKL